GWNKPGALALLKTKKTILNGEWDKWWDPERERNIKSVKKYLRKLIPMYYHNLNKIRAIVLIAKNHKS
ncbi:MAG TPA: hypothetical protein DCK79_10460, partial [Candidatus Atribacteria bacterium]|nr:hypothetical protein [Candidatus Atribacteria bacterium]